MEEEKEEEEVEELMTKGGQASEYMRWDQTHPSPVATSGCSVEESDMV